MQDQDQWEHLTVSYDPATFGDHGDSGSKDDSASKNPMVLVVEKQDFTYPLNFSNNIFLKKTLGISCSHTQNFST